MTQKTCCFNDCTNWWSSNCSLVISANSSLKNSVWLATWGAWHEFGEWVQANGYKTAGDLYECYLIGPDF